MAKDRDDKPIEKTYVTAIPKTLNYGQVLRLTADVVKIARTLHGVEVGAVIKEGERDGIYFRGSPEAVPLVLEMLRKKAAAYSYGDLSLVLNETTHPFRGKSSSIEGVEVPNGTMEEIRAGIDETYKKQYQQAVTSLSEKIGELGAQNDTLETRLKQAQGETRTLRDQLDHAISFDNVTPETGGDLLMRSCARKFRALAESYCDIVGASTLDEIVQSRKDPAVAATEAAKQYSRKMRQRELTDDQIREFLSASVAREEFTLKNLEDSTRLIEQSYKIALEGAQTEAARQITEASFKPVIDTLAKQLAETRHNAEERSLVTEVSAIYKEEERKQTELHQRHSSAREMLELVQGEEVPVFVQRCNGQSALRVFIPHLGSENEKTFLKYLIGELHPALITAGYKPVDEASFLMETKPEDVPKAFAEALTSLYQSQEQLLRKLGVKFSVFSKL